MRMKQPRRSPRSPSSRRRRIGSVMIMVVALLVMLALIGTAYIATSSTDRTAASQNAANTQADLLMASIEEQIASIIAQDNFDDQTSFRPASSFGGTYDPYDAPGRYLNALPAADDGSGDSQLPEPPLDPRNREDDWLASRVPEHRTPGLYYGGGGGAEVIWPYISGPLGRPYTVNERTGTIEHFSQFEDPVTGRTFGTENGSVDINPNQIPFRVDPIVAFVRHGNITYPALRAAKDGPNGTPYVAADNDGDGIADGAFTRLNVGQLQGLTWFVSSRIVDNAGALNLNTAWDNLASASRPDSMHVRQFYNTTTWRPYFPTNIAMIDLLTEDGYRDDEMFDVEAYRQNQIVLNRNSLPQPYDDFDLSRRTDYDWEDRYDLMWNVFGRRLRTPGIIEKLGSDPIYAQRLPETDTLAIAMGNVVRTPNSTSWDPRRRQYLGHSVSERFLLPYTLSHRNGDFDSATHQNDKPYDPDRFEDWFKNNFDYDREFTFDRRGKFSRRPLFTTVNPVASTIRPHYVNENVNNNLRPETEHVSVPHEQMLPYFPEYKYTQGKTWQADARTKKGEIRRFKDDNRGIDAYYIALKDNPSGDPTSTGADNDWEYIPWSLTPAKASLNTAGFRELFRAYWNVMAYDDRVRSSDLLGTNHKFFSPFWQRGSNNEDESAIYDDTDHPHRMFRSPLRDNSNKVTTRDGSDSDRLRFNAKEMTLLRAAIASVNTIDMRDADHDVTSRTLRLRIHHDGIPASSRGSWANVTVYGTEPQPFITEVYANTALLDPRLDNADPTTRTENKRGFVAVELVNPNQGVRINLKNWKLLLVNRRHDRTDAPAADHKFRVRELYHFGSDLMIEPRGHLLLHNYRAAPLPGDPPPPPPVPGSGPAVEAARFIPESARLDSMPPESHFIAELGRVIADAGDTNQDNGGELILVRPRRADGQYTASTSPVNEYNESATDRNSLRDFVPIDQFDFTGLRLPQDETGTMSAMHYVRKHQVSGTGGFDGFHAVYPGRYIGNRLGDGNELRHEGAHVVRWTPNNAEKEPLIAGPSVNLTQDDNSASFNHSFNHPITLYKPQWARNPIQGSGNRFPFGGFGSTADVFRVPFIGAYTVKPRFGTADVEDDNDPNTPPIEPDANQDRIYEMNSIAMDASFADDTDSSNNAHEMIGRFWPIGDFSKYNDSIQPGDLDIETNGHHADFEYRHFAKERPERGRAADIRYLWARDILDYFTVLAPHDDYAPAWDGNPSRDPRKGDTRAYRSVNHTPPGNANYSNVGELPRPILNSDSATEGQAYVPPVTEGLVNVNTAPLPVLAMLPFTDSTEANLYIARQIIEYRNKYGPFAHTADLMRVPLLVAAWRGAPQAGDDPFETYSRGLNRIANLVTLRSDSFTAYVTLQGWRNAGAGANAELVVQRRAVIVFDRSGVIKSFNASTDTGTAEFPKRPGMPRYERSVKSMYMQLD